MRLKNRPALFKKMLIYDIESTLKFNNPLKHFEKVIIIVSLHMQGVY
jgi:hypothetical protein